VTSVSEITGMEGDIITMQEIYRFDKTGLGPTARSSGASRDGRASESVRAAALIGHSARADMFDGILEVR
jgi:pilus assembly protein CpaF